MVNSSPDTAAAKIDWARIKSAFFFFSLAQSLKPNRPFNTSLLVQTRVGWGDSFFYTRRMQLTKKIGPECLLSKQMKPQVPTKKIRLYYDVNSARIRGIEKKILHRVVSLSLWMGDESLFQFPTVRTAVASPWATDISSLARNESIKQREIDMNEIMFILFEGWTRFGGVGQVDMTIEQCIEARIFQILNLRGWEQWGIWWINIQD